MTVSIVAAQNDTEDEGGLTYMKKSREDTESTLPRKAAIVLYIPVP